MFVIKFLIVIAVIAWGLRRSIKKDPTGSMPFVFNWRRLVPAVVILVVAAFILPAVGQVGAGQRGVVLEFGKVTPRILGEGIYVVTPLVNTVEIMDVQVHAHKVPATGASKDLQNVTTEITVNYALLPNGVANIYRDLRRDYVERVLAPSVQESVKASTAQFTAEELITRRQDVKDMVQTTLAERLSHHQIRVDAVSVTNFEFSAEFNNAIEQKVTAAQRALTAQNDLKRVEFEADQRIESAKAEAEAIRIQAESISKQGGEAYVQMKWVEKWNGQLPTVTTGEGAGLLMQINP